MKKMNRFLISVLLISLVLILTANAQVICTGSYGSGNPCSGEVCLNNYQKASCYYKYVGTNQQCYKYIGNSCPDSQKCTYSWVSMGMASHYATSCVNPCTGNLECQDASNHICLPKAEGALCTGVTNGICMAGTCCIKGSTAGNLKGTHNCCDPLGDDGTKCYIPACAAGDTSLCPNNKGVCRGAKRTCLSTFQWSDCAANYGANYEPGDETKCDGLDNDCDGQIDEMNSLGQDICDQTNLLYYSGKFYGCNLTSSTQTGTKNPLNVISNNLKFMLPSISINNVENYVEIEETDCGNLGSWYCDSFATPLPMWKDALIYNQTQPINKKKSILTDDDYLYLNYPSEGQKQKGCCPGKYCFNGYDCEAPYLNPQQSPVYRDYGEKGYRCNATGSWRLVSLRYDYNNQYSGYCNENTDCYSPPSNGAPTETNPGKCYSHNEWGAPPILDKERMCFNGNWTTRTKYVAYALLDYAKDKGEYYLYCDELENALGEEKSPEGGRAAGINYDVKKLISTAAKQNFNNYFIDSEYCNGKDCANNFCVLRYKNALEADYKVIIGTSLNRAINETYPVYEAFGFTKDNRETHIAEISEQDSQAKVIYESDESGILFYSKKMQSIFYSADRNILDFNPTLGDEVIFTLFHPIIAIIDLLHSFSLNSQQFTEHLSNIIGDFDKIYYAKKAGITNTKTITGIQETKYNITDIKKIQTMISVNYTGFTQDICAAATEYGVGCKQSGNSYVIYDVRDIGGFEEDWQDLTSKIRLT